MSQTELVRFYVPLDDIQKGTNAAGKKVMKVAGCASTNALDIQQEVLEPTGFVTDYFMSHGFINYNHQGKVDPGANIGEPTKCYVNPQGQFMVEGELYGDNALAKSTYNTMKSLKSHGSKRKMCWSVEGKVLERDPDNKKRVTKLLVTNVALTLNPVNPTTYADIIKGLDVETQVYDGDVLSPVEVYAGIFEKYPGLEKGLADQIYDLVATIASPTWRPGATHTTPDMAKATTPTIRPEHVASAYELLQKSMTTDTVAPLQKEKVKKTVTPAYDDSEDDDDEPTLEKGIDSSLEQLRTGESRATIIKSLVGEGFERPMAQESYRQAAVAYAAELDEDEDDEPTATAAAGSVSKGMDDDDDDDDDDDEDDDDDDEDDTPPPPPAKNKKAAQPGKPAKKKKAPLNLQPDQGDDVAKGNLSDLFKSLAEQMGGRFGAIATVLQGIDDRIEAMGASFDERIAGIEGTPQVRKSVTTTSFKERQFAGQNVEKSLSAATGGRRQLSLSDPAGRGAILNLLDANVTKVGGYENPKTEAARHAMNAMMHFEQVGTIEKSMADELGTTYHVDIVE